MNEQVLSRLLIRFAAVQPVSRCRVDFTGVGFPVRGWDFFFFFFPLLHLFLSLFGPNVCRNLAELVVFVTLCSRKIFVSFQEQIRLF